jgi:hypothetical protein
MVKVKFKKPKPNDYPPFERVNFNKLWPGERYIFVSNGWAISFVNDKHSNDFESLLDSTQKYGKNENKKDIYKDYYGYVKTLRGKYVYRRENDLESLHPTDADILLIKENELNNFYKHNGAFFNLPIKIDEDGGITF